MIKPLSSEPESLLASLRRLLTHLSRRRRWQLGGLLAFMLLGAFAELATLGAVIPFLALLTDPTLASRYPLLQAMFVAVGWARGESILLPATVLFAVVAVSAAAIRIALSWATYKFTFGMGVDIGIQVYRRTLYQPYSFHVARNTSELIGGINKVQSVVNGVINPLMQGIVSAVLGVAILGALVSIDPVTALVAGVGFGLIYMLVTLTTRRQLRANSKIIGNNETRRVQAVQEGLGGIRDMLIDGTQGVYIQRFSQIEVAQSQARASNNFMGAAPRYIIESIGMVLIAALAYYLSLRGGGLAGAIPVLGALAIGAQKLMPQMQLIYTAWAAVSGNSTILADVVGLLDQAIPDEYTKSAPASPAHLQQGIALRNLGFCYQPGAPEVLRQINLEIPRGSRVGFIGKTGSGKSTVIDLIMGLLEPTSGSIEIDGQPLTSANRRAWQAHIAHVPQSIYLADSSIAANIALGIEPHHIDQNRVREAARKAQLDEFIETLPAQYETAVGERGVRLSGGQRQRIGLARALYKQADVLVLDEATSALDDATEKSVMQAIESLGEEITVLMIAHRVSTLSRCDRIFELSNGILLRSCTYKELQRPSHAAQAPLVPSKV
jgi:ABC-type bacteriocin/lantibiotic exporter with double-glycine peptidase domain